jgi:hypothetical protein
MGKSQGLRHRQQLQGQQVVLKLKKGFNKPLNPFSD